MTLGACICAMSSTDFAGIICTSGQVKNKSLYLEPSSQGFSAVERKWEEKQSFWNNLWDREEVRSSLSILIWLRNVLLWNLSLFLGRLKLLISETVILLLEQELFSLVPCSLPSLSYYKNIPVCGLLALTETPQRTWRSHLLILSLAFKRAAILAGASEGSWERDDI